MAFFFIFFRSYYDYLALYYCVIYLYWNIVSNKMTSWTSYNGMSVKRSTIMGYIVSVG